MKRYLFAGAAIVLIAGILFITRDTPQDLNNSGSKKVIHIAGRDVVVNVAITQADQERGLGGRTGLGADQGMLFVFPRDDRYAFWMKDMRFSIDIVWLSADGTVITIAPNVSPDTYPQSFKPASPARSVLELPAGFARTYGLHMGDRVQLNEQREAIFQ